MECCQSIIMSRALMVCGSRLLSVLAFYLGTILGMSSLSAAETPYAASTSSSGYGGTKLFAAPSLIPSSQETFGATGYLTSNRNTSPYLTDSIEPVDIGPLLLEEESGSSLPPGARDGIFQGAKFTGTWLAKPNSSDFGVTELNIESKFGFPLPLRGANLLITPSFGVNYFDGPTASDLPSKVYDARLGFSFLKQVNDRWFMNLSVTPVVASDFKADRSDALRITGRGIGIFQWTETAKILLGVVYLDRQDVSLLPVAGVIWTPNEDWRFEFVAPHPKIAWRIGQCTAMSCVEHWSYVGFEFGGGEWAVVRTGGAHDVVTMRDYRFLYGIERKSIGGVTAKFEVGYVFGRVLEYTSGTPDFEADDTVLLRMSVNY